MLHRHLFYVYIISNRRRTTFYVGVTNDIERRMDEHRRGILEGFSKRYCLKYLVHVEETDDIGAAIEREKQLKNWHRARKINLILSVNPGMDDLAETWYDKDAETSSA